MAKSELLTASMPSFPMMPTPMWPALIMATSLAPSPIARQHDPGTPNLIMLSICAFWSLRARHATTARHELDTAVSTSPQTVAQYSIPFSSITMHGTSLPSGATWLTLAVRRETSLFIWSESFFWKAMSACRTSSSPGNSPSSAAVCLCSSSCGSRGSLERTPSLAPSRASRVGIGRDASSVCCTSSNLVVLTSASTGNVSVVISSTSASCGKMLHAQAMFLAVPTLSPVSIQILVPASRKSARISGTPSCSLSSMAVAPCSVSPLSSCSCSSVMRHGSPDLYAATSDGLLNASRYLARHSSSSGSSRLAQTSVRSATSAHSPSKSESASCEPYWPLAVAATGASLSKSTESAPLQ
mmetsp:Transcript_7063/g.13837  ORF Transcript_7063/g.13837 Transcript_7063/m.13837 type:complete len:356 (+) Transcript_7063:1800-2867(+)